MEPAKKAATDRHEDPAAMEPLRISESSVARAELTDLAFELARRSEGFRRSLPTSLVATLATLVRSMNCYYSNLIEGHDTHPIDIELALKGDYSGNARNRQLQLEARAHVEVQAWLDRGGAGATSTATLVEIHRRFYELLPDELQWVDEPESGARVRIFPGELRTRDVRVGEHVAVSPGAVRRFLARYEQAYGSIPRTERVISAAAAHHRLLWIHPFLDGNGRVARLVAHATMLESLDTGALWSVARGLARNVDAYRQHLAACDRPRRNDLDGRGALSEESLVAFTRFFLNTCLDQVRFMEGLMQPDALRTRIQLWAEEQIRMGRLPARAGAVLDAILYRGEIPRADVAEIVGTGERHARRTVASLVQRGVVVSSSSRAPLQLAFPAELASRWMPGLFPERPASN